MAGVALVLLGALGGGSRLAGAGEDAGAKGGLDAKAAFARLKTLAGTWTSQVHDAHQPGQKQKPDHPDPHAAQVTTTFRLTGAGSALVETQFPGSAHEMVSVYHLDGDDLRMTHYCAIGNQPRVKLDRAHSRPDHLVFVFDGGSNLDAKKDLHIHGLEVTFHKDGQITSTWEAYRGGKSAGKTAFVLTRH
jgi:hypothetical protein